MKHIHTLLKIATNKSFMSTATLRARSRGGHKLVGSAQGKQEVYNNVIQAASHSSLKVVYLCAENFHASVTHATRASADVNMDEFHFTHKILQIDELFLETSSPNTLVIAINTHGFPDSGHFIDYSMGRPQVIAPEILLNGIPSDQTPTESTDTSLEVKPAWKGFRNLIDSSSINSNKRIIIIMAQCHGMLFAKRLREYWTDKPENVSIVGLSSKFAYSAPFLFYDEWGCHYEILEFLQFIRSLEKTSR